MEKRRAIDRKIVRLAVATAVGIGLLTASTTVPAKRPPQAVKVKPHRPVKVKPHRPPRAVVKVRPHRPAKVAVIRSLPKGHRRLVVGGVAYRYHRGVYYKPRGNGWVVVAAPIGAGLRVLPSGTAIIWLGGKKYHHHNGVYYRWDKGLGHYVVVRAPAGARIRTLPPGYTRVFHDGFEYYLYNGVHYRIRYVDGVRYYYVVELN